MRLKGEDDDCDGDEGVGCWMPIHELRNCSSYLAMAEEHTWMFWGSLNEVCLLLMPCLHSPTASIADTKSRCRIETSHNLSYSLQERAEEGAERHATQTKFLQRCTYVQRHNWRFVELVTTSDMWQAGRTDRRVCRLTLSAFRKRDEEFNGSKSKRCTFARWTLKDNWVADGSHNTHITSDITMV